MIILIIIILVICVLLILAVIAQNSKGGGLTGNFSASTQLMGVKKTGDFLEKTTWGLAIGLIVLCLGSNLIMKNNIDESDMPGSINVERSKEGDANFPLGPADEEDVNEDKTEGSTEE